MNQTKEITEFMLNLNLKIRNLIILLVIIFISIFSVNCGKEKAETKSMDQIHNVEGVPVQIQKITTKSFEKSLTFFGILRGIKESQKNSNVADRVSKVNFKVGDYVKENDIVIQFPIDNPTLQYAQSKAALENSEKLYQRTKVLFEAGETSQANFEGIETQYLVNKRNYESINQFLFVQSPISGRLTELLVKEGDPIDFGKPLFTIAETNKLRAKIWVTEKEINDLKSGMAANLTWNNKSFIGRISEISLSMDYKMRAFNVEIEIPNQNGILKPGLTADIFITTYQNPKAIVLPRNLVIKEQNQYFVFIENNGLALKKEIIIGKENDLEFEILSGITENDNIIVTGLNMLENGKKINIAK